MQIEFNCPGCEKELTIDSSQLGTTIKCPFCESSIDLVDDGFLAGEQEINQAISNLEKKMSEIFD